MSDDCAAIEPLHSAWVDDALDAGEQRRVAAHLRTCRSCRHDIDGLHATRAALRNLPPRRLPERPRQPSTPPPSMHPAPTVPGHARVPVRQRLAVLAVAGVGLLGGAAFAMAGDAPDRVVPVPVEVFVADHLVRTAGDPLSTPVVVDGSP